MRPMARMGERRTAGAGDGEQGEKQAGREKEASALDGARNTSLTDLGVLPRFGNRLGPA
jgi:hypothetical protein